MWQPAPLRGLVTHDRRGVASHALIFSLLLVVGAACKEPAREGVRIVPQVNPVQPRRVAFAPDREDQLLILEATGLVGVWDVRNPGHPVRTAWIPAGAIDAGFSPDGKEIVTAGWDGKVRWWSDGGKLLRTSAGGHKGPARALAIGDDQVLSGGEDGALRLWGRDGAGLGEPITAHDGFVVSVAISANGDLASAGTDQVIRLWQKDSSSPSGYRARVLHQESRSKRRPYLAHQLKMDANMGWDHAVEFSPRGDALAVAAFDGGVRLWGAADWSTAKALNVAGRHVRALAWTPRGDTLAAGGFDGRVALWNADGAPRGAVAQHPVPILSVAFSSTGGRLATASIDRVRLWKSAGELVAELPAGAPPQMTTVAVTESGPLFASADPSGNLRRWQIDGSAPVEIGAGPLGGVLALVLSPNGELLFAGGDLGVDARLFGPNGATTPKTSIASFIDDAAFSPHGDLLAIAGSPGMVELLNSDGSAHTPPFRACREMIHGFAFSPVEDSLAILCDYGLVKLWTLDLKPRGILLEPAAGAARGLAISPSGQLLASGGLDGFVGFWGLPPRRLDDGLFIGLNIDQVGLRRAGSWVLANGNTVFFFDAELRLVATALVTPEGVVAFTPDGSFAGSRGAERLVRAFRADGTPLTAAETAERLAPAKVLAALHTS